MTKSPYVCGYHNSSVALDVKDVGIVNPFYNHTFGDHFFCDTN
jgi:hypothetical protein